MIVANLKYISFLFNVSILYTALNEKYGLRK